MSQSRTNVMRVTKKPSWYTDYTTLHSTSSDSDNYDSLAQKDKETPLSQVKKKLAHVQKFKRNDSIIRNVMWKTQNMNAESIGGEPTIADGIISSVSGSTLTQVNQCPQPEVSLDTTVTNTVVEENPHPMPAKTTEESQNARNSDQAGKLTAESINSIPGDGDSAEQEETTAAHRDNLPLVNTSNAGPLEAAYEEQRNGNIMELNNPLITADSNGAPLAAGDVQQEGEATGENTVYPRQPLTPNIIVQNVGVAHVQREAAGANGGDNPGVMRNQGGPVINQMNGQWPPQFMDIQPIPQQQNNPVLQPLEPRGFQNGVNYAPFLGNNNLRPAPTGFFNVPVLPRMQPQINNWHQGDWYNIPGNEQNHEPVQEQPMRPNARDDEIREMRGEFRQGLQDIRRLIKSSLRRRQEYIQRPDFLKFHSEESIRAFENAPEENYQHLVDYLSQMCSGTLKKAAAEMLRTCLDENFVMNVTIKRHVRGKMQLKNTRLLQACYVALRRNRGFGPLNSSELSNIMTTQLKSIKEGRRYHGRRNV